MDPWLPETNAASIVDFPVSSLYHRIIKIKHRPMCYDCFKPACTCICELINRVSNHTAVTILQHPRERNHPIGTVRFAQLGLSRLQVVVHGPNEGPAPVIDTLPTGTALLYPEGKGEVLPAGVKPPHLLILDGTWHHARKLFQANPSLATLPRFALPGGHRSRYQIRSEPAEHCLSTIEAIVLALQSIEPDTQGFDDLLSAFDRMIDQQKEYSRRGVPRQKKRTGKVSRNEFCGTPTQKMAEKGTSDGFIIEPVSVQ